MDMDDLYRYADDDIWHDGEQSTLEYRYPLPATPWRDLRPTLQNWRRIAERHVVDSVRALYTLTEGVPKGELYELGGFWCARSPSSHLSCFLHAVDFLVPDHTTILAAQDGEIIELVEGNDDWGDEMDRNGEYVHRDHLNFMTVQVAGEEYMQFCHLAKGSAGILGLRVGSKIRVGQTIGRVGKNGVTDRDHLHFIVFRIDSRDENPFGFKSLAPRFRR